MSSRFNFLKYHSYNYGVIIYETTDSFLSRACPLLAIAVTSHPLLFLEHTCLEILLSLVNVGSLRRHRLGEQQEENLPGFFFLYDSVLFEFFANVCATSSLPYWNLLLFL